VSRAGRLAGALPRLVLIALAAVLAGARAPAQLSSTISVTAPLYKSNKKGTSYSPFTSGKPFLVVVRLYVGISGAQPLLDKDAHPWQEAFVVTAKSVTPSAPSEGAISSPIEVKRSVKLVLGATTALPEDLATLPLWLSTQVSTLKNGVPKTVYAESPPQPVGVGAATLSQPIDPASVSIAGQLVIDSSGTWVGPTITGPPGDAGPTGPEGPQGPHGPAGAPGSLGPEGPQGASGPAGPLGEPGPAGTQGDPGPAGTQGPAGLQGPGGLQGPQGTKGAPGNAGVKGALGPAGPKGELGPEGPAGPAGLQGATGPDGPQGLLGPAGVSGPKGEPGAEGPAGSAGAQGPAGSLGPQGPKGAAGLQGPAGTGPGPAGAKGAIGPQGTQGAPGAQGPQGGDGRDGPQGETGIEGPPGPVGSPGATGLPGALGPIGAQGAKGEIGSQGAAGPAGPQGAQGSAGSPGDQGSTGSSGVAGIKGVAGGTGPQGAAGPKGPADVTVLKTANESVVSSIVLQNDNELAFSVQPNETWLFDAWLVVACLSTAPDIRIAFSAPLGAVVQWSGIGDGNVGTDHPLVTGSGSTDSFALPSGLTRNSIRLHGAVVSGVQAGTVRLQWAQQSSSTNAVTIEADSYIRTRKP
jgi:hypothetical protein